MTQTFSKEVAITGVQGQRLERGLRFAMTGVKVFAKEEAVPSIPKEKLPLELIHVLPIFGKRISQDRKFEDGNSLGLIHFDSSHFNFKGMAHL